MCTKLFSMKFIQSLLVVFLLFSFLGIIMIRYLLLSPIELESGHFSTEYVSHSLDISRMKSGQIILKADNEADILFGLGFAHGRDKLWQIQLAYLAANASISSFFGDEYEDVDQLLQLITYPSFKIQEDPFLLQAYADGINYAIELQGKRYPIQFTLTGITPSKWTVDDVIRYYLITSWLKDFKWNQEMFDSIINYYVPQYLISKFNDNSVSAILESEHHNTAISLLQRDKKLREFLNYPIGLTSIKWILEISEANQYPSYFASHQSGTNRDNLWYPIEILYNTRRIKGISTPGLPVLFSGFSEENFWGYVVQKKLFNNKLPISPVITDTSYKVITKIDKSESLNKILKSSHGVSIESLYPFFFDSNENTSFTCLKYLIEIPFSHNVSNKESCNMLYSGNSVLNKNDFLISGYRKNNTSITSFFLEPRSLKDQVTVSDYTYSDLIEMISSTIANEEMDEKTKLFNIYLSNWNMVYDSHSVAASLFEIFLYKIAKAIIRNYVETDLLDNLIQLGYINRALAIEILYSLYSQTNSDKDTLIVNNIFIKERIAETFQYLEKIKGNDSTYWRWGNLTQFKVDEALICGNNNLIHYAGNRICSSTIRSSPVEMRGNLDSIVSLRIDFASHNLVSGLSTMILTNSTTKNNHGIIYSLTNISGNPLSQRYGILNFSNINTELRTEYSSIIFTNP